jgi:hypothetical protein
MNTDGNMNMKDTNMKTDNETRAAAFLVTAAECIALTLGMDENEAADLQERVRGAVQKGGEDERNESA